MRNMLLIARREYLERVRSKAFIFMTIFIPALMLGVTVVPSLIAMRASGTKNILIAASDRETADLIRKQLEHPDQVLDDDTGNRNQMLAARYKVDVTTDVTDAQHTALTEKVKSKQLDGVIWIPDDALAANKATYITRDVTSFIDRAVVSRSVSRAANRRLLHKKGLGDTEIEAALKPVDMATFNPVGSGPSDPTTTFLSVFAMVMIMYVSVLLYGINVMRAVLDEKTSRIMEVMLSTATPNQMMVGKILGVGAVGLTQIAIWALAVALPSLGLLAGPGALKGVISVKLLSYFPVFFLLGYALYSTMYAAIGALANSEQETQQLQFLVAMPLILSVIVLVQVLQHPETPLGTWASFFPFTSPLIMFARIALASDAVPTWQIAVSLALLVATIYGLILLCGRIYRVGILMYGKRPTLPEIVKWIKYA
jgi:ABC-2 type transport system permease protein